MFNDWLTIGPVTIHGYGACIAIGLLAALFMASYRGKKRGFNDDIVYGIVFCSAIFGFLSAKIMYCLVEWKDFIKDPLSFITSSGFVVFGGITGGIFAVFVYSRIKKFNFVDYLDLCMPSVALGQAFGRIGCFFAGCCYGRETDCALGITFHNSLFAPNNVKLIPTQLISSAANFLNMALLLFIAKKTKKKGIVSACYVIFYSVGRFFIEMFRNDDRGAVGALSTSQFYGIITLVIGVVAFFVAQKKNVPVVEAVSKEASVEETKEDETV